MHDIANNNATITTYFLLSTVTENREFYVCADIEGVDRARIYQGPLGWISTGSFNTYVNKNFLPNCNITVYYIDRAEHIYGEATSILQGKMRRKKPTVHSKMENNNLPLLISERHNNYTITWKILSGGFYILTH